jgi:PPM family protein phosphatase
VSNSAAVPTDKEQSPLDDQLANRVHRFLVSRPTSRASASVGDYAVATTTGLVRNENQDATIIVKARYGSAPDRDFDLAVVCDGLGGMKKGGDSAVLGLSCFVSRMIRSARIDAIERVDTALGYANMEIFNVLRGGGGTTLSAILVSRAGPPVIGHVGDSRIYSITHTDIQQLTQDDTLEAVLNRPNGEANDLRNSRLIQFVGIGRDLEPHIHPSSNGALMYLLTSDGAHDVPHNLLRRAAAGPQRASDLANKLIQLSESLGGRDNATVAVVPSRVPSDEKRSSAGLDLEFISPYGRLDVWIPQLVDDKRDVIEGRQEPSTSARPGGLREERSDLPPAEQDERQTAPPGKDQPKHKSRKSKKKKARKKAAASEDGQLSLPSASVDIDFPEREDDNK